MYKDLASNILPGCRNYRMKSCSVFLRLFHEKAVPARAGTALTIIRRRTARLFILLLVLIIVPFRGIRYRRPGVRRPGHIIRYPWSRLR